MMTIGTKIKIKNYPLNAFIGQQGVIVGHAPEIGGATIYKVRIGDMILSGWFTEEDLEELRRPYKTLFFDLDGTLTDISEGVINSIDEVLLSYDIQTTDLSKLRKFLGKPIKDSFMRYYGFSEKQAEQAVDRFQSIYNSKGITEQCLFSGIHELLEHLHKEGFRLVLVSKSPIEKVCISLAVLHISSYFTQVIAHSAYMTPKTKADLVNLAIRQMGMTYYKKDCVVIGDRPSDMEAASLNSIDSIGVLWGYGSKNELRSCGASHIVETPQDLINLL